MLVSIVYRNINLTFFSLPIDRYGTSAHRYVACPADSVFICLQYFLDGALLIEVRVTYGTPCVTKRLRKDKLDRYAHVCYATKSKKR